jgi:hypothetical protein
MRRSRKPAAHDVDGIVTGSRVAASKTREVERRDGGEPGAAGREGRPEGRKK